MTWLRRAEANKVTAPQLVERAQQLMLIRKPPLVLCDDGRAVAVGANPIRISPLAAAADIDGVRWHACMMLVENPAHRLCLLISSDGLAPERGAGSRVTHRRCGNGLAVDARTAALRQARSAKFGGRCAGQGVWQTADRRRQGFT